MQQLKKELNNTMCEIHALLRAHYETDWEIAFQNLMNNANNNPDIKNVARNILKIYGGAGSFNDFLLQTDGKLPVKENEQLDKLKHKLHTICVDIITN